MTRSDKNYQWAMEKMVRQVERTKGYRRDRAVRRARSIPWVGSIETILYEKDENSLSQVCVKLKCKIILINIKSDIFSQKFA